MFKSIASTFLTKILSAIINLAVAVIISRWTGAEGKGIHGLFIATLGLAITFIGVFGAVSITYLFNKKPSLNYILISNIWAVIASIVIHICLTTFSLVPDEYVLILSITCFLASVASNNLSVFLIKEQIIRYNLTLFSQPILNILLIICFYWFKGGFSIQDYFHSLLLSYVFLFFYSVTGLVRLRNEKLSLNLNCLSSDIKLMFKYGILNQVATIIQMISFRGTYFILEQHASINDVGVYSNAVSIAESVWLISRSLSLVFYARMINSQSKSYHQRIYQRFSSITFFLQTLALLLLISIPKSIYTWLFGAEFHEIKSIIIYLVPATMFFGQSLISGHYFSGTGRHLINLISNLVGMIIVIIFGLILIPMYYAHGAALSTSIGFLLMLIIHKLFLKKYLGISPFKIMKDIRWLKIWMRRQKHRNIYIKNGQEALKNLL